MISCCMRMFIDNVFGYLQGLECSRRTSVRVLEHIVIRWRSSVALLSVQIGSQSPTSLGWTHPCHDTGIWPRYIIQFDRRNNLKEQMMTSLKCAKMHVYYNGHVQMTHEDMTSKILMTLNHSSDRKSEYPCSAWENDPFSMEIFFTNICSFTGKHGDLGSKFIPFFMKTWKSNLLQ